jgi:hypothetical protein
MREMGAKLHEARKLACLEAARHFARNERPFPR